MIDWEMNSCLVLMKEVTMVLMKEVKMEFEWEMELSEKEWGIQSLG
jgi:hypothetical protein